MESTTGPAANFGGRSTVIKKLSPATPGAKRYANRYGNALVCVRYRDDPVSQRRLTTIELVVEERPLPPPVGIRIAYGETELRQRVKAAGGIWDAAHKLWRLPITSVRQLKLTKRIVTESA